MGKEKINYHAHDWQDSLQSDERFQNLIYSSPSAIGILMGPDLVITTANAAIIEIWGKGKQIMGQAYFEALPELAEQGYKEIFNEVYTTGIAANFVETPVNILQNGKMTLKYYNFVLYPQHTKAGIVEGIGIIATEVTHQAEQNKRIKESEERFQNLVRDATVGIIVVTGTEMKVEIVNNAYAKLIDRTAEELLGKELFKIIPEMEEYFRPVIEVVRNSGEEIYLYGTPYFVWINDHKKEGFLDLIYQPYREADGTISGVMVLCQDVTAQMHAQQKLVESEKKFQAAILAVEGIIWTNNAMGEMEGEQPGWVKLTGQTFEEYIGKGWARAVHPDDAQPTLDAWNEAVKNKSTFVFEHRLKTAQNEWRLFSVKAVPFFDEKGVIHQWVGVHTDISEQREAAEKIKESENRFRNLAETLPQLVWITDEKGAYEYASGQWMNYSGLDPLDEETWEKLVHPDDMESLVSSRATTLLTGETYRAEVRLKNKIGTYRWHLAHGQPIRNENGNIIKWIGAFTDIENLKAEQQRKDDFLSMASHELKTPVTTIKAYGQLIEGILEEKGDEKTLAMVKKMSKQITRLNTLISDLLDVTKMQKGGLPYNESYFALNELINEIIDDMQKTTVTHQIKANLGAEVNLLADRDKLGQVLNNLLSNAIKYSPKANQVIVSTQLQKEGVSLSVQDFGIGISMEEQKHVFQQFYRVTGENQSTFPGMGIGLYICAEIIKREGGKIWVESSAGNGSVFHVWLPLKNNL